MNEEPTENRGGREGHERMNVGLLTAVEEWGGADIHAAQFARALEARGHRATMVCLTQRSFELYRDHEGDRLHLLLRPTRRDFRTMGFLDWLRYFSGQSWKPCVLIKGYFGVGDWKLDLAARYSFGTYLTIEQLMAEVVPRASRRHFGIVPGLGLWWRRELLRGMLRSAGPRKIICVSEAVRSRLMKEYRFPARKLVTISNGIDTERFRPDPELAAACRRRWGIPDGALVFGAVGRFAPMKGYRTALSGFQALLARFPGRDLRLVLVGQGEEEAALRAQADAIAPGDRVVFSPFTERPWEALSALDVFLMPSLIEGLPLALLEAMACGCCPVAMGAGGIPEVLTSAELGWLVPIGDGAAFAAAMLEAASCPPAERAAMGKRARGRVQESFDSAVQLDRLVNEIESATRPG